MRGKAFFQWSVSLYVILVYAFYPTFHLSFNQGPETLYQYLTQSFLAGHLSLLEAPLKELLNLANPYDPAQNINFRIYDASLYQGKYYLYFGPLPVLVFFLPLKWLTGLYPTDSFAVFFFLTIAFLVNFHLLIKIRNKYFSPFTELQLILTGFLLGFATNAPLLLSIPRVYEVAISSAFCCMSIALFFLYEFFDKHYQTRHVFLLSLFLSLSVAGRPHFALVCLIFFPVFLIFLMKHVPKNRLFALISALLLPSIGIGILLALYNYLRFDSIWDFGHIWQLSCNNIQALHTEMADLSKIPRNILFGFYYYFLQPYVVNSHLPYLSLRLHPCWYQVDNDYTVEGVAGVLTTTPFIILILILPKLISIYFKERITEIPLLWFLLFTLLIPTINAVFLMTLPFAIQRYEVDFIPYLVMLSILTLWLFEGHWKTSNWYKLTNVVFNCTAVISIFVGLGLGLAYWILL
ncbi:hypothetical protein [Legionella fairfieldensis]|uniref:hypothetical protein n=1 Tax=Legionella fairfieldensis TaxID=45064 RepID=UPI00048D9490|nr:hypothetical protein [Legionella fairfieldensis]